MNVGQLQNLKSQVKNALEQAEYIKKIRDRIYKGSPWKVTWNEGTREALFTLTPDQKDMLEETMIKDMELELELTMRDIRKSLK